jgi:hypothetical protein
MGTLREESIAEPKPAAELAAKPAVEPTWVASQIAEATNLVFMAASALDEISLAVALKDNAPFCLCEFDEALGALKFERKRVRRLSRLF